MKQELKKSLIIPLCMMPSAAVMAGNAGNNEKNNPNIILIYCDDMGYGDLGVTGNPNIKTPVLDRMAVEGTRFTNYYSASPASTASRYAMMTGKYPARSGFPWVLVPNSKKALHENEITQAEGLKSQGYKTAIFGKWHLGSTDKKYLPLQNGFDRYVGLPYSNDMIPPKWPEVALMSGNDTLQMNPDQSLLTELYTREAISFIKENKKDRFFIYLPYAMPHVPLHPGKKFAGRSTRGIYGDVVEEIDWAVGEILQALQEAKVDKNTIVWFISDNGPWIIKHEMGGSSGLFRDGKGSTWEGGVRVPCIAYCPGRVPAAINDEIVTAMDVYATNLWMGGYELPAGHVTDGHNIASYLGYKGVPDKSEKCYVYCGGGNKPCAIRVGKWKLHLKTSSQTGIQYFGGKVPLLFNLDEDPSENYDLSEKYPEIVRQLKAEFDRRVENITRTGCFYND